MNSKVEHQIVCFMNSVAEYLNMEYDSVYYETFISNSSNMFDFVGSYYLGGSTVPDTARYVVELILMNKRNER